MLMIILFCIISPIFVCIFFLHFFFPSVSLKFIFRMPKKIASMDPFSFFFNLYFIMLPQPAGL